MADIAVTVTSGITVVHRGVVGNQRMVVADITTASGMTTAVGTDTWANPFLSVVTAAFAHVNTTGLGGVFAAASATTATPRNVILTHGTTQGSGGLRVTLFGR